MLSDNAQPRVLLLAIGIQLAQWTNISSSAKLRSKFWKDVNLVCKATALETQSGKSLKLRGLFLWIMLCIDWTLKIYLMISLCYSHMYFLSLPKNKSYNYIKDSWLYLVQHPRTWTKYILDFFTSILDTTFYISLILFCWHFTHI